VKSVLVCVCVRAQVAVEMAVASAGKDPRRVLVWPHVHALLTPLLAVSRRHWPRRKRIIPRQWYSVHAATGIYPCCHCRARFSKREVNLGLVDPRSEGYPEGKSWGSFGVLVTRVTPWFTNFRGNSGTKGAAIILAQFTPGLPCR